LAVEPILAEPLLAALPEQHDSVCEEILTPEGSYELPLIAIPRNRHPYWYDQAHSICIREGFEPKIVQEVTSFPEAMALVADGVGFSFTRECCERFRCPAVVFKKIEGQPLAVESAIVFRKDTRSSILPSIISKQQNIGRFLPFLVGSLWRGEKWKELRFGEEDLLRLGM
jgi:DNA-binding transcriptional LysR family regulator